MPNMFGGSQFHPAYGLGKVGKDEILIGDRLYKINPKSTFVSYEDLDGHSGRMLLENCPAQVKRKHAKMRNS